MTQEIQRDANGNFNSYRGFTIYEAAADGTYWVSGLERWMTLEQIDALTYRTEQQAVKAILSDLGHKFSGSIQAQIAACEIAKREDETQCQDVYTHPGLRGEYRVDW